MTTTDRSHRVVKTLLAQHPDATVALRFSNPLELLVAVILSAQCTDARVNEVTRTLFRKYRKAADYAAAQPSVFEQEIHATGFYRNKAKAVINCCRKLVEEFGGRVPRTVEELTTLPGVGRKTANMVLGNAFGIPAIAVDTHVLRVSQRLGLARGDKAETVEQELMDLVPRPKWTLFSNAAILHGRETCTARKPNCRDCALYSDCRWPDKVLRNK